jgi:hypothetical protein
MTDESAAELDRITAPPERLAIPAEAAAGLAARYRARQVAETSLIDFLSGIVLGLGLDMTRVQGFDDETCELLLEPE